ncbi:hypothetical protein C4D60_Mb10t14320 [Musa balbisiana]|uniref:Uncharacterized protein n=1 Tax=Musa balbisiana TaxID=52838 RepID=A0A4S8IX07_MUSBA|nr:hypothetical protein C4D60_Mb10t14320 [Musa balbisiana]
MVEGLDMEVNIRVDWWKNAWPFVLVWLRLEASCTPSADFTIPEKTNTSAGGVFVRSFVHGIPLQYLAEEKKVIRIVKMDGEILRYRSPMKVQQVLDEFPGHAVSDALPVVTYLDPALCLRQGQLYYLLPPKKPAAAVETSVGEEGVIRIKLVITKQQLKDMLSKGGVSHGDMVSFLRGQGGRSGASEKERSVEWKPTLESIPEGNDFC